ncbi:myotubularin-related protein 3 isoform X2 [Carassius auratus]|uniref:phosphatidylinositol-3,5-bisphosphate 3-phosphatase n=1 Tax=Carassius auratus TaxID=7957 RepID=A0A6P6MSV9_CARAU|nr:myotubularin-related protein 3-like isoform X2 [Carassius auratus]
MTVAAQLRGERHGGVERITLNVYIPFTVSFLILPRFYLNGTSLLRRTREAVSFFLRALSRHTDRPIQIQIQIQNQVGRVFAVCGTQILSRVMVEEEQQRSEDEQVPFPLLQGECVERVERAEESIIALTSYRLHIRLQENVINVPLQLIESVECADLTQMQLTCKDCKLIRCNFLSAEQCQDWLRRMSAVVRPPSRLEELFAFSFLSCSAEDREVHDGICRAGGPQQRFKRELERMGFHTHTAWRISNINSNYRLCSSYPEQIMVPASITDLQLEKVSAFRSWKRIPAVVYRHRSSGAVIGRCGQPEVSWWGWRNADDELLIQAIAKACVTDPAANTVQSNTNTIPGELSDSDPHAANGSAEAEPKATPPQKLLIMDARSYAAAVANRAKGGGCECPEYYPNCEVMFMGMANIHSIRKSFQSLRTLCAQAPDPVNWLSALEGTRWLQHLSLLLKASLLVVNALDRDRRPVLVHCSDGWDRTPQIVALSKLLLDPFYRTIQGFQVLVETEWLDYGHKFGERCGHGENADDQNERCPVFLQWLDCVHQLQRQFPCSFQFNEAFLVKLVQHTYSCLFGTFLCNSVKEREERGVREKTCSVWALLRTANTSFHNILYSPRSETVLHPVCHVRNLMLWSAVYLPNSAPSTPSDESCVPNSAPSASPEDTPVSRLPKTRSYEDLPTSCEGLTPNRRSSDPNLNEKWHDRRLTLEISGNHTQTTDQRLSLNTNLSDELNTDPPELSEADSQMHNISQEEHRKLDLLRNIRRNTPEESPLNETNQTLEEKHPLGSQHPLQTNENIELTPDRLLLDNSTNTHDSSECSSQSSMESSSSPNHTSQTPNGVCSPSQHPLCPSSDRDGGSQMSAAGDSSPTSPHKRPVDVSGCLSALGHLDKDGLSVHSDAVQVRLRQMEAGHQLQVETLKKQVQELWSRLHVNRKLTSVPDVENNMESDCLQRCGKTDLLSESSWEQMGQQEAEWFSDHAASRCYGCERTVWLTARKHHCRNCGNVFCSSCCDQKVAVSSQQLRDHGHVCQACYGHLRPSAVPPALPPADLELEKPISASST